MVRIEFASTRPAHSDWLTPLIDGPALRAITIIGYANWLIDNDNSSWVTDVLWPVVKLDLDYVATSWNEST